MFTTMNNVLLGGKKRRVMHLRIITLATMTLLQKDKVAKDSES